jgi:hypothetical protein
MPPHTALFPSGMALQLKRNISEPILAPLMENRLIGWMIVSAAGVQSGLTVLGLPGWSCPFLHVLGLPCPGCGLSRATAALLRGDWSTSATYHAFAPLFLLAFVLLSCSILLPERSRIWLIRQVERVERRTGITAILLVTLVLYWLIRLLLFPNAFINLIKG